HRRSLTKYPLQAAAEAGCYRTMKAACLLTLPLMLLACEPRIEANPADEAVAPVALPDPGDPQSFVGLYLTTAQAAADQADVPHRVVERDGESLPRTMDHRPGRLNFAVADGRVVKVTRE